METFPRHCFNNCLTKNVYREVISALTSGQLVKVQDFSENYTFLVPDEVQSLRWAQAQVTIFPVVTFRRDEDKNLIDDHLVFLSDYKIHDSAFVELVNNKIHEYYEEQNIVINHDIELNDGCASQFKSINAFWLFVKRGRHTDLVYFE